MEMILDTLAEGGPFMYVVLAADVLGIPCVILSLLVGATSRVTKKGALFARIIAWSVVLGALTPLFVGALGAGVGFYMLEKAASVASPDSIEEMRAMGTRVALIPLKFGSLSSLLYLAPALFAVVLVPSRLELEAANDHY